MSYKSDMEFYREQHQKHKRLVGLILKCSIIVLAVAVLVATAAIIVTFAFGDRPAAEEEEGGAARLVLRVNESMLENGKAVGYLGESIAYKSFVTVSGGSGEVALAVDTSAVNASAVGEYTVRYTATDAAGNKKTLELTLVIRSGEYTPAKLNALVEAKAKELGLSAEMSKEVLVQKIYAYVNDPTAGKDEANIYFSDMSNAAAQQEQQKQGVRIRTGWESDWIEEAIRTLSMSRMEGDCFTYYSVSKAFFEYFGIENMGIQRAASSNEKGTHFWCIVNVGTEAEPKWYYYDATRLAGQFGDNTKNACLIDEAKLRSYRTSQGGTEFYKFDKWDGFPEMAKG
ncbi:MAG: DUF5011 domain-containing protein [Ruminococcaceae bacterium]|nr:DUF5011 domain-containing protein [Oscillospiraceae bacterium]